MPGNRINGISKQIDTWVWVVTGLVEEMDDISKNKKSNNYLRYFKMLSEKDR